MNKRRVPLLLVAALVSLAGCTSRAGSGGTLSGSMHDFLRRYGRFSPAEALAIAVQIETGPHDLAVQRAAARREGSLLTLKDMQAPLPPPERNAAPIYARLARLLKQKPLDPTTDRVRGSLGVRVAHSPEDVARVRRLLVERRDVMDLVHEAAARLQCVFRRDWTRGMMLEYPENVAIRESARLLSAESDFLAREGRYQQAIAEEGRVFRLAEHPPTDACVISQLVGMACDAIALAGMENILCTAGPNAGVDEAVRKTIAAHRPHFRLRRALEGEIVIYATTVNGLRQRAGGTTATERPAARPEIHNRQSVPPELAKTVKDFPPAANEIWIHCLDAGEAYNLELMRSLIAASGQPYVRSRAVIARLKALDPDTTVNPVIQLAAPAAALGDFITYGVQARAQEEVTMAGAAVLAYKARHGSFPDRLEQALAPPPPDPFAITPLVYRREAAGFVVYSAGPDGDFDGSKPGARRVSHQAYFRYPAIPWPPQRS